MTQHTLIKRSRSPQKRQRCSTACSVKLDLLCPLFRYSSNIFTGAHQNTLENVPVIVLTWVLFSSCTLNGAYNIVGNFTVLSSVGFVIRFLQPRHVGFGLSCVLCTHCAMAAENLKRYLFLCKVTLAAKSESYP
jgi:hypothetical protein